MDAAGMNRWRLVVDSRRAGSRWPACLEPPLPDSLQHRGVDLSGGGKLTYRHMKCVLTWYRDLPHPWTSLHCGLYITHTLMQGGFSFPPSLTHRHEEPDLMNRDVHRSAMHPGYTG